MRNYEIVSSKNRFHVLETKTNFTIEVFQDKQQALKLAKRLNNGFAFAGETPSFFIRKKDQIT